MKNAVLKTLCVLLLGIMPYFSYAEVPGTITFQGYLLDGDGKPLEGTADLTFSMPGWFEEHFGVYVKQGLFSIVLGNDSSLADIDFSQVHQMQIQVNGNSQSIPISSVPHAFHAKTVEQTTLGSLVCNRETSAAKWDGSQWQCVNWASLKGEKGDKGDQGPAGESTKAGSGDANSLYAEATKREVLNTVSLDMDKIYDLCRDKEGCNVTVGMRDPRSKDAPGEVASTGPHRLFLSQTSNYWRLSTNALGEDGNGTTEHILNAWDCYFTDGEYIGGSNTDNTVQLGLLNWNDTYKDPNMVCILIIED